MIIHPILNIVESKNRGHPHPLVPRNLAEWCPNWNISIIFLWISDLAYSYIRPDKISGHFVKLEGRSLFVTADNEWAGSYKCIRQTKTLCIIKLPKHSTGQQPLTMWLHWCSYYYSLWSALSFLTCCHLILLFRDILNGKSKSHNHQLLNWENFYST